MNKNDGMAFKRSKKSPEGKMMVEALETQEEAKEQLSIEDAAAPATLKLSSKGLKIETLIDECHQFSLIFQKIVSTMSK